MKRRELLAGASALAALSTLPRDVRAAASGDYDFVIVGAGTAGLPAAIFASRRGARVLMLDAAPVIGGTLHLSTGQMAAAGTKLQKAKGIVDTPDAHYRDAMRINRNTADAALVRLAVDEAATTLDWLMDHGLEVLPDHPVYGSGHEFYTERRYQWAAQGGRSILAVLQQQLKPEVDAGRVTVQLSSPVTSLLLSKSGAVEGVRAKTSAGEREYRGRHVLLTVGGYASNSAMFEKLNGVPDYGDNSYPYSQGAGIDLGLQAGGYVRGRQNYLCSFGAVLAGEKIPSPVYARFQTWPQKRPPWEVYVNAAGARFIREDEPSVDRREHALLKQPDMRYWIVFDDAILDAAPPGLDGWDRERTKAAFAAHPMFKSAPTLAALAEATGIDRAGLERTIAAYNRGVAAKRDALGRAHLPAPVAKPPYYAIRMQGFSTTSTVGLAVDGRLRVLREKGGVVPNLYAAGELLGAGQTMGNAFVGGMMVTPALSFGRWLGQTLPA
jgi:fumarate reductase flavoprotein subunit